MISVPTVEFQKHFFKATIDLKQTCVCHTILNFNTSGKLQQYKFSLNLKFSPFLIYPISGQAYTLMCHLYSTFYGDDYKKGKDRSLTKKVKMKWQFCNHNFTEFILKIWIKASPFT